MRFDIDSFRANFKDGARSYLFYYKPVFPGSLGVDSDKATYLVKTAALPETTTEEITTSWQGQDYKVAGKYSYSDWQVSFNVDKDAKIITAFQDWANLIHDPTTNMYTSPADYMSDQQLDLLGLNGEPIMKYKLMGCWLKSINSVTLDYSQNDFVQLDVTFSYVYHVIDKTKYGNMPTFG